MTATNPNHVLVLGATGLIGNYVASDLARRDMPVVAVARRFTAAQRAQFGGGAREIAIAQCDAAALTRLVQESAADVVVNCLGLLQDVPGERSDDIHRAFVERLLAALRAVKRPVLLVHLSIPGVAADDRTEFARTKRAAETAIVESGLSYAILRPGFVFAPAAYGGSAMLRALAALPFDLAAALAARPFAIVAMENLAETVYRLTQDFGAARDCAVAWDLMHPDQHSLGDALARLRTWLGVAPRWRVTLPGALLTLAAWAGDLVSWLGWRPPIRSTALAELRRGVAGDPGPWMAASGIAPQSLDAVLSLRPATVQEKWFARLYPLKALIVAALALFWCASALIALTAAYPAAVGILTSRGFPDNEAQVITIAGSVMDFCVGLAIAFRRTSRWGLIAGIVVSLFYMLAAAVLTPDLWIEPLGALVKTGPAIVLMVVALAIGGDR